MVAKRRKHKRPKALKNNPFLVVGIGASAGGLDAFTHLLRPLPIDTGMAFVLVQHLDPGHKSMLTEILGRETRMPVCEVADKMRVEPNHVYVTPPNAQMRIQNGVLYLVPRDSIHGPHMPIDYFLRSLAADKGPRAIAVILSGADGDGAQALTAIKAEGGIAFAQDARSAKFGAMPAHAVETGLADFILPPDRIAQELVRIARVPAGTPFIRDSEDVSPTEDDALSKIYYFLRRDRGVDFTYYKQTTLRRRIQRRMLVHNVSHLKEYLKILQTQPKEIAALYDDLLIHVTHFFRDPDVFESLKKKAFPHLQKKIDSQDGIRIWIPGCATGEEVYSIAISLLEFLGHRSAQLPIHIFATDISETALQKARVGIYPASALRHVSAERLRRFFSPVPGGHQIHKSLRRLCVFSKQNVAKDPPFSRLDLISCRNLLIYLGPVLQKKVLPIFHFALKPSGLLLLGKSETLRTSELFNPFDKKMKLYSKGTTGVRQRALFSATDYPAEALAPETPRSADGGNGLNLQKEADQFVLGKRAPAGIIVDGAMNIIQFRGDTSPYLELAPGAATFQLYKLAKEGLLAGLRQALHKAQKENIPVTSEAARLNEKGHVKDVSMQVVPLHAAASKEQHFLILFEEARPAAPSERTSSGKSARGRVSPPALRAAVQEKERLRKELAAAKDFLQSVIDEHERITEELKSANEEALSSNEEFQSTNEELETAKEELQATNEETSTLNDDLQSRNVELNQVNNDLLNLTNSVSVPTVILGKDHHIRRMTSSAERVLNMTRADIGRSIHDLKLTISVLDLKNLIDTVLHSLAPRELDIQDVRGHWYHLRIQLYKTSDDVIDGVVLSLTDIQMAKEHQAAAAAWTATLEKRVKQRTEELAQSQAALLQAEKLEAIGRLAGGVAHDFNNLMTGILLISQDLRDRLGADTPHGEHLKDVITAARKAVGITKQLLAFGRRQVFAPQVLNLNEVFGSMQKLLQRLLGEDIDLISVLDPTLGHVNMDPGVVEQVILNLALNARDAMPQGGKITIQTANTQITASQGLKVAPGLYVVLTVSDEGSGIRPEIMPHIFEPFFTTKKEGKGTGLGLATVYGIVKQSGGAISVESKLGEGTLFHVYLPRLKRAVPVERRHSTSRDVLGGTETILVTEDEDILRKAVIRALQKKGYTVLQARNGPQALKICQSYEKPIHLLLTDVIMSGMNGRELAVAVHRKRPGTKILYMSGHNREIIAQRDVMKPGSAFIEKSFSSESLCQKVREVLDKTRVKKKNA